MYDSYEEMFEMKIKLKSYDTVLEQFRAYRHAWLNTTNESFRPMLRQYMEECHYVLSVKEANWER